MSEAIVFNDHVTARLTQEPIIWLSTVRKDGRAHLVPVWFLWDGTTILIYSKADQKIRNLQQNPNAALALNANDDGEDIVIMDGIAALSVATDTRLIPAYTEKYATLLVRIGLTAAQMSEQFNQVIRITPTKLRAWVG
jgi:PPOX class probable F420-dependent enzyme